MTPCQLWPGPLNYKGYGSAHLNGRTISAHRLVWFQKVGDPGPLMVLHKCRNRNCVRVDHLYLGTAKDNARDCIRDGNHSSTKFRAKLTHCKHGHPLSGDNLRVYVTPWGTKQRQCRACNLVRHRRDAKRKVEAERGEGMPR